MHALPRALCRLPRGKACPKRHYPCGFVARPVARLELRGQADEVQRLISTIPLTEYRVRTNY